MQVAGIESTSQQLQRVYGPVGLDLGADTPEAIALSIIAEIQAILNQRSGGFLKNRTQSIHQPSISSSNGYISKQAEVIL